MVEKNLKILPKFSDNSSFIYIEKAVIEKRDSAIVTFLDGAEIAIPAATINVLFLGPGTNITHGAMVALADAGTSVVWTGAEGQKFYASGIGKSRANTNLMRQVLSWSTDASRLAVVRRMYELRFHETLSDDLTLQQIRGKEGARVRDSYAAASREYGVEWLGRRYSRDKWKASDPINRALSAGASCLYGICHSAIVSVGYSPGIGFIHVGKQLSFVYDVADFYKAELLIPCAFQIVGANVRSVESEVRKIIRERARELKLLDRVIKDLNGLFLSTATSTSEFDELDTIGALLDSEGVVPGGINYAGDDDKEGSS